MEQELRDRFITLEAGFNNFKHDHNEEAKVRHQETDNKLDKLFAKLNSLNCGVHQEKICGNSGRIDWLYIMFGAVVLGGIVFGIWVKAVAG